MCTFHAIQLDPTDDFPLPVTPMTLWQSSAQVSVENSRHIRDADGREVLLSFSLAREWRCVNGSATGPGVRIPSHPEGSLVGILWLVMVRIGW